MDVAVTVLARQALGVVLRVVVTLAFEDHLRAEVLHRLDLDGIGGRGRAADRADAEQRPARSSPSPSSCRLPPAATTRARRSTPTARWPSASSSCSPGR